jgi:hypothetical protein
MLLSDFNINLKGNRNLLAEVTGKGMFEDFSTTGSRSNGTLILNKRETVSKEWENRIPYGGIDVELYYQGSIDIQLNDARYTGFRRESPGHDRISLRFADTAPGLLVTSTDDHTIIHEIIVRVANF